MRKCSTFFTLFKHALNQPYGAFLTDKAAFFNDSNKEINIIIINQRIYFKFVDGASLATYRANSHLGAEVEI